MADRTIGEIALQGSAKLIFTVGDWHGRMFANVRKFVANQKYQGPTKSGLSFNKNLLRGVISLLTALNKSLPAKTEQEIGRLKKNDTDYIRLSTIPNEDDEKLPAVDLREYVDSVTYQGPTKQGIRFRWDLLPDVLACFKEQLKVIAECEREEPSLFGTGAFAEPENEPQKPTPAAKSDGIVELLGEPVKSFPDSFLECPAKEGSRVKIPDTPLRLEEDNFGKFHLHTSEGVFCAVRNPPEGYYIIYAQLCGHRSIVMPKVMLHVFKCVKAYENYVRAVQTKLTAKVLKKVGQSSVAEYEARKKMSEAGLPWLSST